MDEKKFKKLNLLKTVTNRHPGGYVQLVCDGSNREVVVVFDDGRDGVNVDIRANGFFASTTRLGVAYNSPEFFSRWYLISSMDTMKFT